MRPTAQALHALPDVRTRSPCCHACARASTASGSPATPLASPSAALAIGMRMRWCSSSCSRPCRPLGAGRRRGAGLGSSKQGQGHVLRMLLDRVCRRTLRLLHLAEPKVAKPTTARVSAAERGERGDKRTHPVAAASRATTPQSSSCCSRRSTPSAAGVAEALPAPAAAMPAAARCSSMNTSFACRCSGTGVVLASYSARSGCQRL